jgi:8-oxo-dGTP pyrophosphatase MutT (NUDIX family)
VNAINSSFIETIAPFKKHFTASAVVIEQSHILLIHHKRIAAWLPPGGHLEDNEFPHQTAIRETKEETGLHINIISSSRLDTKDIEAFFLPEPLAIHAVKAVEAKGIFYHIDIAYLAKINDSSPKNILPTLTFGNEVNGASWVELKELAKIPLAKNVIEIISMAKSRLKLED